MSFKDVNDRDYVIKAIKEYDAIGQKAFLNKYGFGKSRNYFLLFLVKYYDSKAILGVAHKIQFNKHSYTI